MSKYFSALLCAFVILAVGQIQAASKGPQTIRFYKVNKQQQADRLRFTQKKAKLPGCHNLLKRTRVKKVVQIGYAQCQLFAEKDCAVGSVVKVSRDDKAEQIKDAEEEYQVILTDIIKNREARDREKERKKREEAEEKLRLEMEAEAEENTDDSEEEQGSDSVVEDSEFSDVENESDDLQTDSSESESAEIEEKRTKKKGKKSKKKKEKKPKDYEAIEAGLIKRLESLPNREQIIDSTPESLTETLTEGYAWYPESENLRGVKLRSWSCDLN